MDKIKYKIIKVFLRHYDYDFERFAVDTGQEWKEANSDEFGRLRRAVDHFNRTKNKHNDECLVIISPTLDEDESVLLEDYEKYLEKIEKEEAIRKKKAALAAETRKKNLLEKKKKELAKLEKELGEE